MMFINNKREKGALKMKKIKRIISLTLIVIITLIQSEVSAFAATPTVSLPSTSNAYLTGYTIRRTVTVTFNSGQPASLVKISSDSVVGCCYAYIGRYRCKQKIDNKNYDAILVKCAMAPRSFKNIKGYKFYGFTESLSLNAALGTFCDYQYNTPTNSTIGETSYSIEISGAGSSAAVVGSVQVDEDYCKVIDKSSITNNKFSVLYDYIPSFWSFSSSSARNVMLFQQTWQMATCEWTTSRDSYNVMLNISAGFGFADAKNGPGIYDGYVSKAAKSFGCFFTKNMQ